MIIRWNGHSCFTVETAQGTVVLDPYAPDSVPGLPALDLKGDAVLCSHGHADHSAADQVTLSGGTCAVAVEEIPCYHDKVQGAKRGPNTIRILAAEGMRVAHLGDLGHPLDLEQVEKLKKLDALMIPVGGFFTIDAAQAKEIVEELKPRVVIPMHYRGEGFGYDILAPLDDYLSLVDGPIVRYPGNSMELTPETFAQTAVLACPL